MNKHLPTLYIGAWMLYSLQGSLYSRGSIVSQVLLAIILIVSMYYCFYANMAYKLPIPLKVLTLLLFAWTACSLVSTLAGIQIRAYGLLKNIYMSQLPIFVFYVFGKKRLIDDEYLKKWFFVFVIIALFDYYEYRSMALEEAAEKVNAGEEITNNASYVILSLLPLLPLFNRRPILQYVFLGFIMLYVLIGYKRGAIAVGIICSIWFIIRSFRSNEIRKVDTGKVKKHVIIRLLLTLLIVTTAVYFVQYLLINSDYFSLRMVKTIDGDTSGRDEIYSDLTDYFLNQSSLFHFLFGNGEDATVVVAGHHAHNDWLEIAVDNGLVVVVLYAVYWLSWIVMFLKGNRKSPYVMIIGLCIIIYFLRSFVSMSYFNITIYAGCIWGYALANYEYRKDYIVQVG